MGQPWPGVSIEIGDLKKRVNELERRMSDRPEH
jgi:hypothetical protein